MMPTVTEMRVAISKVHDSPKWKHKVANMYDNQVIAVYHSFWERGKFNKNSEPVKKVKEGPRTEAVQLSFEDVLQG